MELNKKEKYIKTVLENADYKLDSDLLWNSIESKVQKPKRDRKWLWFLSGMGSFALLFALVFPVIKNQILAEAKKSQAISAIDVNQDNTTSTNQKQVSPTTEIKTDFSQNETTQSVEIESDLKTTNNNTYKEIQRSELTSNTTIATEESEILNQGQADQSFTSSDEKDVIDELPSGDVSAPLAFNHLLSDPIQPTDREQAVEKTENIESIIGSDQKMKYVGFTLNNRQPGFIYPLISIKTRPLPVLDYSLQPTASPRLVKVHKPVRWTSFFAVKGGIALNRVNAEILSSDISMDSREFDREKGVYGYSLDFQYGLVNNSGWYVMSGVDIHDKVVRYENYNNVQSSSVSNGVVSVYTDRDGVVEESLGPINEVTITNYNRKWYRSHQAVNIQFMVGKKLAQIGHFSISAEMGMHYNIFTKHKGYYFEDQQDAWTSFESGEDHPYRTSSGIGLRGGLNMNYQINNIALGLHSFYKYDPKSLTGAGNFYNTNNNQIGLQLGIAYHLDR